jgi:hypothetical protein
MTGITGLSQDKKIASFIQLEVHCRAFYFWHDSPQWARASSFTRFLDHTQQSTIVGRDPLDE